MIRNLLATIAAISSILLANTIQAKDCVPREVAPGAFLNTPKTWGGTDSGPILNGFLDLKHPNGTYQLEHGVDLSHHNDAVTYSELKRCGASFAIIKMDHRFSAHKTELKKLDIDVIPYHYLSVSQGKGVDYKKLPHRFSSATGADLGKGELDNLLTIGRSMGTTKAKVFVEKYKQSGASQDGIVDFAGLHGRLLALDVEEHFPGGATSLQKKNFGRFYAAMLSSWISEVRESIPDSIIIFYTFPSIYTEYLQFALPADNAVIHGMPIWLAGTRGHGGDFDLKSNQNLQRICLSSAAGNRCILHQYTHRGIFAVLNSPPRSPPRHIDLNRLFIVKTVKDGTGVQFVRRDD